MYGGREDHGSREKYCLQNEYKISHIRKMYPKIPRQKQPAPYSKNSKPNYPPLSHQTKNSIHHHAYTPCTLASFHTTSYLRLIPSSAPACPLLLFKKRAQFGYLIR